jgi:hypothetical protein
MAATRNESEPSTLDNASREVNENTSDGYHTFKELYDHRIALFIALMKSHPDISWRANNHEDGSMFEGWFVAGMHLPTGDISYHLPQSDWMKLDGVGIATSNKSPEWDGHTPADVVKRLMQWAGEALSNGNGSGGDSDPMPDNPLGGSKNNE